MRRSGSAHQRSAHQRILQCKKDGSWQDACQILAEMRDSGRNLGTVSYNAAIDACGKSKQVGRALELFDELVQAGNVPDAVTYTALIDACGRGGLLDQAFTLFARYASARFPLQLSCLCIFHAHPSRASRLALTVSSARNRRGRMQAARVEPNLITYNALIHACAQVCIH